MANIHNSTYGHDGLIRRMARAFEIELLNLLSGLLSDKVFLKMMFPLRTGYRLRLENPVTFNEKLQWMKLYNRRPEYTMMVDKVKVKKYVASLIGEEFIIPTLGVWEKPTDINFDELPDKFVLKCNHNSGKGMFICKDKSKIDRKIIIKELSQGLKENYYLKNREWPYKDVPRRVFAEQYIESSPNVSDLTDYKWFCFNGEPKYCQVIQDRSTKETIDFFDIEWNHQEFVGLNPYAGPALIQPKRPITLEKQISIVRLLSKDIPFARIDLYEVGDKTYFGEITFYPKSGMGVFTPRKYDNILGDMILLPKENKAQHN